MRCHVADVSFRCRRRFFGGICLCRFVEFAIVFLTCGQAWCTSVLSIFLGGFAIDYLLETFVVFRTCGQAWIAQLVVCVVSGKLVGVGL